MSDRKNIDRLFQEKFKDFELEPQEHVWKNIEEALKEKKERKVIPFWFKAAGIAAALLLGFFTVDYFSNKDKIENNVVLDTNHNKNNAVKSNENNAVVNQSKSSEKEKTNKIESSDTNGNNADKSTTSITEKSNQKAIEPNTNAIANDSKKDKNKTTNTSRFSNHEDAVAEDSKTVSTKTKARKNSKLVFNQQNAVANENAKSNSIKNNIKAKKHRNSKIIVSEDKTQIAENNSNKNKQSSRLNTIAAKKDKENKSQKSSVANQEKNNTDEIIKNTISEGNLPTVNKNAVADNKKTEDKKLDSTAVATVVPNALEELLKKNEEEKKTIAESKVDRWQITSNVAPIYFSSTSNGSPIDKEFSGNSKSYENNISFGVGVNYAVTKKIAIRTGINKFTLGYNTNNVAFSAGLRSQGLSTITSPNSASTIQVSNNIANADGLLPFETTIQGINEGMINQKMGYYEVPIEMSYAILDKKFGINLIGGLSTLFLNENEVSVISSTMTATLGKANNLSDVHFSTNIGLGFKYKFFKSFEANFEPTFKYQINTFTNDSGNFKPYFIGLYTGISFKF